MKARRLKLSLQYKNKPWTIRSIYLVKVLIPQVHKIEQTTTTRRSYVGSLHHFQPSQTRTDSHSAAKTLLRSQSYRSMKEMLSNILLAMKSTLFSSNQSKSTIKSRSLAWEIRSRSVSHPKQSNKRHLSEIMQNKSRICGSRSELLKVEMKSIPRVWRTLSHNSLCYTSSAKICQDSILMQ
jgi:hypothetical protein